MATLEQFLRTGELGPIRVGMTQAEAVACLGPAQDESVQREPKILKYGGLQITFARLTRGAEGQVALIGLYYHARERIPALVSPTDFTATSETTLGEMREFVVRFGLSPREVIRGDDIVLTLPSGVEIVCGDQKLWSILFAARIAVPHKKQVSVSIPDAAWQQLNTLARESNRSVADLCAEWLTKRASEVQSNVIASE
jgi:hypothetical protein